MAGPEIAQTAEAALTRLYEKKANKFSPLAAAAFNLAGEAGADSTPVLEGGNLYPLSPEGGKTRVLRLTKKPPPPSTLSDHRKVVSVHLQIDDFTEEKGETLLLGTFTTNDSYIGPTLHLSKEYRAELDAKGVKHDEGERLVGGFVFEATCVALGRPAPKRRSWMRQIFSRLY